MHISTTYWWPGHIWQKALEMNGLFFSFHFIAKGMLLFIADLILHCCCFTDRFIISFMTSIPCWILVSFFLLTELEVLAKILTWYYYSCWTQCFLKPNQVHSDPGSLKLRIWCIFVPATIQLWRFFASVVSNHSELKCLTITERLLRVF